MAATTALRLVPQPGDTQQRIASSIEALADIADIRHADLAEKAQIGADKLSKSLSMKRRFSLEETERLAEALGVAVVVLYEGGDELRRRARAAVGIQPGGPNTPNGQQVSRRACDGGRLLDFRARGTSVPSPARIAA